MRTLAGPATRVIDLRGRTVIPGLIDSHLHAIRAALSFSTEVNWIGARSLEEALGRIRDAARTMKPGSWLIVAGGWNVSSSSRRTAGRRRRSSSPLPPSNPVYVQLGYGWAMLTPLAHKALGITSEADLPAGGRFERDASGALTGAITGRAARDRRALRQAAASRRSTSRSQGTKAFFRELNRLGDDRRRRSGGNN